MPQRIQRKRTKGWRMPAGAIVVSRPSEWGNPFTVSEARGVGKDAGTISYLVDSGSWMASTREEAHEIAVKAFRAWLALPKQSKYRARAQLALRGHDLACWCAPGLHCHADVLIEFANQPAEPA